jgi:hypothetical protein
MNRKLTLSVDSAIIDFAHDFSKKSNKPISRIFENYFIELRNRSANGLPGDLEELYGIFEGIDAPDKSAVRKLFHEKHND